MKTIKNNNSIQKFYKKKIGVVICPIIEVNGEPSIVSQSFWEREKKKEEDKQCKQRAQKQV